MTNNPAHGMNITNTHPAIMAKLRHFDYSEIPITHQGEQISIKKEFALVARTLVAPGPAAHCLDGAEITVSLRNLLDARNCAFRALSDTVFDLAEHAAMVNQYETMIQAKLRHFVHDHMTGEAQAITILFQDLAEMVAGYTGPKPLPMGPELYQCVRLLVEAKDCAVRAYFDSHTGPSVNGGWG